ncbi:MAG: excinuclease ABC subunit C [Candidatus Marinimicrobia bacterium]|nr:excinuclease ABC subunit C [Candidatus Neomarinimicrobiota bacterium]MBL7059536.1 excinuclease ABC subunit C [Candidatus Neomarinimicrobiota bacterium]
MDNSAKLKQVPNKPGVYLFRNEQEEIIYIGKAKILRNRVRSYFQKNKYQTPKNQSMIKRIANLEWIVVSSEVEALLTEANLIKQHKPKYNIDLKDDKSYPFIRITNEPYPRVFLTRDIIKDGSKYFGPYTEIQRLRYTLKSLHQIFQIRTCTHYMDADIVENRKIDLCLDYHIKKCDGPCQEIISQQDYNRMIKRVIDFLHGKTNETEQFLNHKMKEASNDLRFEDAGRYRDQLDAVIQFRKKQRKVTANFEDRDVFAIACSETFGIAVIVRIRQGRLFSREKISYKGDENDGEILRTIMSQFYLEGDFIPRDIALPSRPNDEHELNDWLRKKRNGAVNFLYPQRGEKAKELRIAKQNAKLLLGEWIIEKKKRKEYVPNSINRLRDDLQLTVSPRRIEAFDISHLGGTNTVASMVCFIDGKPKKKEYRKFNVKTVSGIDDFASMREVVFRRYHRVKKEGKSLPDLILIDGGKGQLSSAVDALIKLKLDYIPIVGLAKRLEEVFIPGNPDPQSIAKQSAGLMLLRKIRDEAHRFAITFQRYKRKKTIQSSIFSTIPGMGDVRTKKLLMTYPNVKTIASQTPEALKEKIGISVELAKKVIALAEGRMRE